MFKIKPRVPGYIPWIAIGYKYNPRRVVSFIKTKEEVITSPGNQYLSKDLDQFSNVAIQPFIFTQVLTKLFGYINEIDCHNNSS